MYLVRDLEGIGLVYQFCNTNTFKTSEIEQFSQIVNQNVFNRVFFWIFLLVETKIFIYKL